MSDDPISPAAAPAEPRGTVLRRRLRRRSADHAGAAAAAAAIVERVRPAVAAFFGCPVDLNAGPPVRGDLDGIRDAWSRDDPAPTVYRAGAGDLIAVFDSDSVARAAAQILGAAPPADGEPVAAPGPAEQRLAARLARRVFAALGGEEDAGARIVAEPRAMRLDAEALWGARIVARTFAGATLARFFVAGPATQLAPAADPPPAEGLSAEPFAAAAAAARRVEIRLRARIARRETPLAEVLALRPGALLALPGASLDQAALVPVGGDPRPLAVGAVGARDGARALRIGEEA